MSEAKKTAVVTGSARGIGKAIAIKLAEDGHNVVVSDILYDEAQLVSEKLEALGVKSLAVKTDISKFDEAEKLIKATVEEFGSVDFLVNNAGITRDNLSIRMSEEEWDMVININLKGTFLCSQCAAWEMMKKRYGRIVNIASVSGILGTAGQANYASSKAGVIALTKSFARELGSRNITVNAVAPGYIETDLTNSLPEDIKAGLKELIPLGRIGTPEEIAKAVAYLASDDAAYMTGHVLTLDGGMAMF